MENEKPAKAPQKKNYEQNLSQLEQIVEKLEVGGMTLEESMKLFEQGVKLSAQCTKMLDSAQTRIDVLFEENGMIKTKSFGAAEPPENEQIS